MFNPEFLLTALVVVLVPGTGVIYTVSTGLALNRRSSFFAALGCTLGIVPHLTASILGLSAILHLSAQVFQVIKWVGVVYLLYLAWNMWRDSGTLTLEGSAKKTNAFQIASKGILINILNPKLTIFFLAFLPLFISPDSNSATRELLGLSIVFMVMTFVVFVLYGLLASAAAKFLTQSPKAMRRLQKSFALIFAGLAAKLAFTEQ